MANIISFNGNITPDDDSLQMSNGLTDAFINVLALSGSELAQTESEKRMIVYLSEKDQGIIGIGCVGFDIVEMPWDKKTFEEDKRFIISIINGARNKIGWEKLDYTPNEEYILRCLDTFENLIDRMTADNICENSLNNWLSEADENDPVYGGFPKCRKHNTFLTCFGCQICNN
ncbi:MAG: hypothetical protein K2K44_12025 [Oscillospiraceae bacterium]|nr:hypothetical protein [Oscillospiraceae bacterium]